MDVDQRVYARDLENARDARVGDDEVEPTAGISNCAGRRGQGPYSRGVEEAARTEVDHDAGGGKSTRERLLETRGGREIEVAEDVDDDGSGGRRLDAYVKIVERGHES